MPVTGLVIQAERDCVNSVTTKIEDLENAEVTDVEQQKIIAVTATEDPGEDKYLIAAIQSIEGVVCVNAIYHNFEDMEAIDD